jgi:hypothetical protein
VQLTLAVKDLFQVIGYALLDFDDEPSRAGTRVGELCSRSAARAPAGQDPALHAPCSPSRFLLSANHGLHY